MKKPLGITALALILIWLSIAGFLNSWAIFSGVFGDGLQSIGYVALAYGVTALLSAYGLWRMRRWSLLMLRAWMSFCMLGLVIFLMYFSDWMLGGAAGIAGFLLLMLVLFLGIDRYVKRRLQAAGGDAE